MFHAALKEDLDKGDWASDIEEVYSKLPKSCLLVISSSKIVKIMKMNQNDSVNFSRC